MTGRRSLAFWVRWGLAVVLAAGSAAWGQGLPAPAASGPTSATYSLDQFGPIGTTAQAQATLEKAVAALVEAGGGVILIPAAAPADWQPENLSQTQWRLPEPPAPAKSWGYTKGVTLVDNRGGAMRLLLPHMPGAVMSRTLSLPEGQSANHWDYHPMLQFDNSLIRGTTSYHDWIVGEVRAGRDQRIYVRTLRGLFPGMFVNTLGGGPVNRLYLKSLGYDRDQHRAYVVADVDTDVGPGALLSNKTHANVMRMDTYSHTENQTFDFMAVRHNYSQGDNYMIQAYFEYMGDVHSTAGDENGVIFAAFARSQSNGFRGAVESYDPAARELKYTAATNAYTLGTGRPLINLNPDKCLTEGRAIIVHPGGALLNYGGTIRSKDAPWTAAVVGRYFAVDEPDEYIPGSDGARRWYYISQFSEENGLKRLSVVRHWWGAKEASGISRLYNPAHYTVNADDEANWKPLRYIIAPGANVYDVSRGVQDDGPVGGRYAAGARERILLVAPGPHSGTNLDFAAGDPIEQAVGYDPFKPIPFRSWLWDNVPGAFPAPVLDVANHGAVQRYAALRVAGGSPRYSDYTDPAKPLPQIPFNRMIDIQSAAENGIVFNGEVADAALLFTPPSMQMQPIQWTAGSWDLPITNLAVSQRGDLLLWWRARGYQGQAGGLDLAGQSLSSLSGLAGAPQAALNAPPGAPQAANFRGVAVPVPAGSRSLEVTFPTPEAAGDYAVVVSPSWMTTHAVTRRAAEGFTVEFGQPAPAGGTLDWMVVR